MAIINCAECGSQVSSKAISCPKCGNPIASEAEYMATGTQITTTQSTAKTYKAQSLAAGLLIIVGMLMGIAGNPIGAFLGAIGLFWYIVVRFSIWWNHG